MAVVKPMKSEFARMVEHADAIHHHCEEIITLVGDILTQVQHMDNYAQAFRNQLTDTIEEHKHTTEPTAPTPDEFRENLRLAQR